MDLAFGNPKFIGIYVKLRNKGDGNIFKSIRVEPSCVSQISMGFPELVVPTTMVTIELKEQDGAYIANVEIKLDDERRFFYSRSTSMREHETTSLNDLIYENLELPLAWNQTGGIIGLWELDLSKLPSDVCEK